MVQRADCAGYTQATITMVVTIHRALPPLTHLHRLEPIPLLRVAAVQWAAAVVEDQAGVTNCNF